MTETVIFQAPELAQRPLVGRGCCAVSNEWLIEDAIGQLPGVEQAQADDNSGEVTISFDPSKIDISRIAEELESLGFGPVATAGVKQAHCC